MDAFELFLRYGPRNRNRLTKTMNSKVINDDVSIVLGGEAGQGIQTVEYILTHIFKLAGYNVFATKEYMSRVRGGSNSTEIRVASKRVASFVNRIDILIPLDKDAIPHLEKRISPQTVIIGEKEKLATEREITDVPFSKIALEIGGSIFANIVAVGILTGLFKIDRELIGGYLRQHFSAKAEDIIQKNILASEKGYDFGLNLSDTGKIKIKVEQNPKIKDEILLAGTEAVSLGAIAGGCNFVASYPMTPSTGVLTYLSQQAKNFEMIVEQAEDEIAAINMALGAWYAGARGLVTTSGGGFALMVEGMSLAGMLESPLVVHLAQRPGPATGLPTRTEQADLQFALYAGHGEFPKIIFAPGKPADAFYLTQKAFNLADKYQVPVIILTDQHLIDSYANIPKPDLSGLKVENFVLKTDRDYKRYKLTENGISPRGIPGYGEGLVVLDSDEHNEEGHITEDLDLRNKMVEKRLKKLELIKQEIVPPELIGDKNYHTLVIGWGSTYNVIKEALQELGDGWAFLYFQQVYPLSPDTINYLKKAKKTVIVENNATGQFAQLIKLYTGFDIEEKILKYNGMPFALEEVVERLKR